MMNIEKNLKDFTQSILLGKLVTVNERGEWALESGWKKSFFQILGRRTAHLVDIAQAFSVILDSLESTPIYFGMPQNRLLQKKDFLSYLRAAEAILAALVNHKAPFAEKAWIGLRMRVAALKYRLEFTNGGLNSQAPCMDLQLPLRKFAIQWKNSNAMISEKKLKVEELLAIEEVSRFPEFAETLLDDEGQRVAFFNWALRDQIPVSIFVQFPALAYRIVHYGMNGRIGRIKGSIKLIKACLKEEVFEKIITLPFEGRDISILDGDRIIEFRGSYKLTISEVFQIFKDKNLRVGNLEFMSEGIINWNVQKWGYWNAVECRYECIDLSKNNWWSQLPVFEVLTLQQAKERYGSEADGAAWLAAATATRERANLDVDLTHAYLEVAIPINEHLYAVMDYGKLANEFPATFLDTLAMVCNTVHATIAYPDENVFYSHRQHAQEVFAITPENGSRLMDSIKLDMMKAKGLNFVYQVESENCAKWVHEKLEIALGSHAVPNMFVMSIFHTEPLSFLGPIINFCKIFPESWQIKALTFFHIPLGASKGHWVEENNQLVWRALTHHPFWTTGTIYLPCFLHKQKELGHLYALKKFNITELLRIRFNIGIRNFKIWTNSRLRHTESKKSVYPMDTFSEIYYGFLQQVSDDIQCCLRFLAYKKNGMQFASVSST